MPQDIRELLRQDNKVPTGQIRAGHQKRFMEMLDRELPQKPKSNNLGWLKIAASIVVIFSISVLTYNQLGRQDPITDAVVNVDDANTKNSTVVLNKETSPLAEISPEYEKIENYFLTSIKFELSKIEVDDTNRELVESFMRRLEKLDREYQQLNKELVEVGLNSQIVEAMTENLQLRLTLLNRLKQKLKELERIENENYTEIQA